MESCSVSLIVFCKVIILAEEFSTLVLN